jgi:hypothetical protein
MQKHWLLVLGVLTVLTFLGCPTETEDNSSGPSGPAAAPGIPSGNYFFEGEAILMETAEQGVTIYYTLDGTNPFIGSAKYNSENLPIAQFGVKNEITVKALAARGTTAGTESEVVSKTYLKSIPQANTLAALAQEIALDDRGDTVSNPVPVKVSAEIKRTDIELLYYEGTDDEIVDGIGGLYKAFGQKYVALDLSGVDWRVPDDDGNMSTVIPGMSATVTDTQFNQRVNRTRLVSVIFPKDTFLIQSKAFRQCTNLQKIDLSGLSKLKVIEDAAFQSCTSATEIDFTGCTSLQVIWNYGIAGCSQIRMLDLSSCTSFQRYGDYAFTGLTQLRYIEFPPVLLKTGEYSAQSNRNLRYIRFRTPTPANDFGWSSFLYVTAGTNNLGIPYSHYNRNTGDSRVQATMQVYQIFHPNTPTWTLATGDYWPDNGTRDSYGAHHVPLPYSGDEKNVYSPEVDALRGEELLAYAGLRGQDTVTVAATGLDSKYNGKTVTSNIGGVTGVISGGAINLTIPTPTENELQPLNDETGQIITGWYRDTNVYNSPGGESGTVDAWRLASSVAIGGAFTSSYGKPWVWPNWQWTGRTGDGPKFAFLQLTIPEGNNDGTNAYLLRHGKTSYINAWMGGGDTPTTDMVKITQTMAYVYVDQDTAIFRYRRGMQGIPPGSTLYAVWMTLKKGWNPVEVHQDSAANGSGGIKVWVSGGVMVDDKNGAEPPNLKYVETPTRVNGQNNRNLPFKEIPWVVREEDTYEATVSPTAYTPDENGNLVGPQWVK